MRQRGWGPQRQRAGPGVPKKGDASPGSVRPPRGSASGGSLTHHGPAGKGAGGPGQGPAEPPRPARAGPRGALGAAVVRDHDEVLHGCGPRPNQIADCRRRRRPRRRLRLFLLSRRWRHPRPSPSRPRPFPPEPRPRPGLPRPLPSLVPGGRRPATALGPRSLCLTVRSVLRSRRGEKERKSSRSWERACKTLRLRGRPQLRPTDSTVK